MQNKQDIISQIRDLGLAKGDTVFVSSDLLRVGYFNKDQVTTLRDWVDIFTSLLGDEGTIVVPTYSPSFFRFFQKYDFVFTPDSDSDSYGKGVTVMFPRNKGSINCYLTQLSRSKP